MIALFVTIAYLVGVGSGALIVAGVANARPRPRRPRPTHQVVADVRAAADELAASGLDAWDTGVLETRHRPASTLVGKHRT